MEPRRDEFNTQRLPETTVLRPMPRDESGQQKLTDQEESSSMQGSSDAALFSRVLQKNRLPKPKMMTFDGDPKKYKLFMASF